MSLLIARQSGRRSADHNLGDNHDISTSTLLQPWQHLHLQHLVLLQTLLSGAAVSYMRFTVS
jgi:hypothetical protein